jgi:hypothetical protein
VTDANSGIVLSPTCWHGGSFDHYLSIFDQEKGSFMAVYTDSEIISFFELFGRGDGANLKSRIGNFAFVEEEVSSIVAERVVCSAEMLLGSVIFGCETDVYGVLT